LKTGEDPEDLWNFPLLLWFLINIKQKNASEKRDGNCLNFANNCRAILLCLHLADGLVCGIFHYTYPIGTFA
jgi:hypothetical protein